MAGNLLALLPKLSETECKLIKDAMYDYDPKKPVSDLGAIGLLNRERVIAALRNFYWVHGTIAALALACKLQELQKDG
jgi:hypothetical protein